MDKREPDVIRFAANPLYNSFDDIHRFMKHLEEAMAAVPKHWNLEKERTSNDI